MTAVRDDGVTPVIAVILLIALTVIFAVVTGAAFLSTASSVGSAKIVAVSAEAGTADSPVFIHLTGGRDLEELVKVYAYDGAGNNFAVTKDGAVFSPGLVLETEQMTPQSGGLQRVSLTGEFADGTKQFLWEGDLTLVEGREIVWMKCEGYYNGWTNIPHNYWKINLVDENTGVRTGNVQISFRYYPDSNTLKMEYYPDPLGALESRESTDIDPTTYGNIAIGPSVLFEPFQSKFGITIANTGRIKFEKSNQIFKIYTG